MKTLSFILLFGMTINMISAQEYQGVNEVHGLSIGADAPMFNAMDDRNHSFSLEETLKTGPVVLIFYRGFWCPFCNKHLEQIQDSLGLILEKGAHVIAVSPEKPEYLEKMKRKSGAEFKLLYDEGYTIADAYRVNFTPEKMQLLTYNVIMNAKLKETHSDESERLPIPATFIINQHGKIVWRQFDPDYKKRSSVFDIINNLPSKQE